MIWKILSAFDSCSSLSEITLPPNLTEIETCTLYSCTSLTDITLPPNRTAIEWYAFWGCTDVPISGYEMYSGKKTALAAGSFVRYHDNCALSLEQALFWETAMCAWKPAAVR